MILEAACLDKNGEPIADVNPPARQAKKNAQGDESDEDSHKKKKQAKKNKKESDDEGAKK